MDITIRTAEIDDSSAIARLHLGAWRRTYAGIATAEAFAVMDEDFRLARWHATLSKPGADQLALVAEQDGRLVGIGICGAPRHAVFGGRGEIRSLYVDADYARRGIGRALLRHLSTHLGQQGYSGAALGVVVGNDQAMAFYQALGARPAGRYTDPGPVWRSENIAFLWDDLAMLTGTV